ncbi:MAG TPA: hypothetical protein VFL95_03715, partial [Gemmatimonadales bacterium]|nr:hypothetical protein [Gemmatimonadales bacterium]
MKRLLSLALLIAAPLAAQEPQPAQYQTTVDTAGVGAIIDQAMNHSQVMATLEHLSDVIGPRLSGSPAMRKANDWTAQKFREYGLTAALEPYTFGVSWTRGPLQANIVSPFKRNVMAASWAWTAGTNGQTLTGPVVRIDAATPESLKVYQSKIKGAWVMLTPPARIWNPDGPPMTAEDSAEMREARQRRFRPRADTSAAAMAARAQFRVDLPYLLKKAGALGELSDGSKEHALFTMSGSPLRVSPLPHLVVSH